MDFIDFAIGFTAMCIVSTCWAMLSELNAQARRY